MTAQVREDVFDQEVLQSPVPVVVDFWATWCGPCKAFAPTLDAIAEKVGDTAKVVKVEIDDNPGLAARFSITSVPTLVFFQDGKEVDRAVGALPASEVLSRLNGLAQTS